MEATSIRMERTRRGYTQRLVAERAKMNSTVISGIESRKVVATKKNQQKIVGVLGGSVEDFFDQATGLAI